MPVALPAGDYYGFVTQGPDFDESDVYSWTIRDPLPTLPVPLRQKDGHSAVDLAAAFVQTYEHGRYGRVLQYDTPPALLRESDRAWAANIAASTLLR